MKELLAIWIVWQLVIIGVASVDIHNEMVDGTLDCQREKMPGWIGAVLPLAAFVPDHESDYCALR